MSHSIQTPMPASPFALDHRDAYARWREERLANAPTRLEELVVEVGDPRQLSAFERGAILDRCRRTNMAIYAGSSGHDPDKGLVHALGTQLGLRHLDHNMGADEDAVTSLSVQ